MGEPENYPRMLYRPGKGQGEMVWGHRIDTRTVESSAEERVAQREGWLNDHQKAVKGAMRRQRAVSIWAFYVKHWQNLGHSHCNNFSCVFSLARA
jgi:hypothetical protein